MKADRGGATNVAGTQVQASSGSGATQTAPSGDSAKSQLRGRSYDDQVQLLAPRDGAPTAYGAPASPLQMKASKDGGDATVADGDQQSDGDDEKPGKISGRKAVEMLEGILDSSNAPLTPTQLADAQALVAGLGKKKAEWWTPILEARIKSGDAETRLSTLLDGLDSPISADAQNEAQGLLEALLENRRPQWENKLADCVAWGAAETEVETLLSSTQVMTDDVAAAAQTLISKLPEQRRAKYETTVKDRLANDSIEVQLRAIVEGAGPVTEAQATEAEALIGTLTNGKQGDWKKALSDRLAKDLDAVFEGDEATRTAALSTLSVETVAERADSQKTRRGGKEATDKKTRVEFYDKEVTKNEIANVARGEDQGANIDALVEKQDLNLSQKALIGKAKEFLGGGKEPEGARAAFAELSGLGAVMTLGTVSLDGELVSRMKRFTKFGAWAGLLGGAPIVTSGVRSAEDAHDLSTRYMFTTGQGIKDAGARAKVAKWAIANTGKAQADHWFSSAAVGKLKAGKGGDDTVNKQVLLEDIKGSSTFQSFDNLAAEGYEDNDPRRMPNVRPTGPSAHCVGNALDVDYPWLFSSAYDPMIDLLAAYFGLWRPVKDHSTSPEHWHYQKLGVVVASNGAP